MGVRDPYVEVAIPAKVWWKSKAMLFNLATLAAVALGLIIENATALGVNDQVKVWIGIVLAIINAAVNLYLRAGPTSQPIAATRGKYQIAELPRAEAVKPPPHPAIDPPRWDV